MATFTVANGGGNINAASTYTAGVGIPGAADEIVFTTTSGQLTVNVTTTIQDINFSNYTNIITFNAPLSVSRNITFGDLGGLSTYTVSGSNALIKTGTGTLTSNGKVWPGNFTFGTGGNYTVNLQDKISISGTTTVSGLNIIITLNSNNILDPERFDVLGDFVVSGTGIVLAPGSGGALIKFTGTANQSVSWTATGQVRTDVKIDKTGGTLTFSGTINYNTGTFTYVQGTVNSGTSTLAIANATTTMNTNGSTAGGATTTSSTGINWYNLTLSTTLNLTSNFTVINTLTANVGTITRTASENVYLGGNLTMTSTLTSTAAAVIMNGTGTWSGSGVVTAPLTINTTGTITISGSVTFSTRTLTYTTATSVVTTGSTLNITASCTLATNGITWNNILSSNAGTTTITLSSNLLFSGTLSLLTTTAGTVTFSGVGTLSSTLVANVSLGHENFGGGSTGASTINFPSSTVLSITNLTVRCGGNTSIGYNTTANNVTFNISGNLSLAWVNQDISRFNGTSSQINMVGTGTLTANRDAGTSLCYIVIPFNVNTSGTITSSGNVSAVYFETTTITYTTGTITGVVVVFITCTLNLNNGGKWGTDVVIRGNTTLTSNATFGNLTTNTTVVVFSGAFTVNVEGNLAINITTSGASTPIVLNGTGAQTWSHGSAVNLSNNLTINKASGTLTVSGNVYYTTGTLTYTTAGSVTTTGSTLNINGNTTLSTNGINWVNVSILATAAITLSNNFTWTGTFSATAGTITFSGVGSLVSSSGSMSLSGTSAMTVPNAISLTTLTITSSGTTVLKGDLTCSGLVSVGANGVTTTINNDGTTRTIIATNGFTVLGTTSITGGTVSIRMTGGTITASGSLSGAYIYPASFEIAGDVTFASGSTFYFYGGSLGNGVFTYTSGTVTTTNSNFWVQSCTLNSQGINWNNVWILSGNANPLTLTSNMQVNGLLTLGFTSVGIVVNNNGTTKTITAAGGISLSGSTSVILGTANINCTGGTITGVSSVQLRLNLTLNGNITFASGVTFSYNTGTLTYTSGTITTTNSTLSVATSTTFATNGMTWNIINWSGGTLTLTNALTAIGLITVSHQTPVINGGDLFANGGMTFTGVNNGSNFAATSGSSTIRFEGAGSWTSTQSGTYRNNVIVNPTSSSFTINIYYALGTITHSSTNGGNVTSASVVLGYGLSPSGINATRSTTFDTNVMRWDTVYVQNYTNTGSITTTLTLNSNLNVGTFIAQSIGNAANDILNFSIAEGANLVNVGTFNQDCRFTINLSKDFTCRTLAFSTGVFGRLNNNTITVTELLTSQATAVNTTWTGTAKIVLGNNCTWSRTSNTGPILFNMEFQGNLTIGSTAFPVIDFYGGSLVYTGKNVESPTVRGSLQIASNATLLNFNKVTFTNLIIASGLSLTMNEFFSGRANQKSIISASSTTNYTITFSDSLEKLAFYVKVSRATISRANQLTVVTNGGNNGNNVNIKFAPNQLPNSLPKNNPLVSNQSQLGSFLLSEPIYN